MVRSKRHSVFSQLKEECFQIESKLRSLFHMPAKHQIPALPRACHPIDLAISKKQSNLLWSFLMLFCVCATYSYASIQKYYKRHEMVPVYIAQQSLLPGKEFQETSIKKVMAPRYLLPSRAIDSLDDIKDQTLIKNIESNEIITSSHFYEPVEKESLTTQFEDGFVFALDESWFGARFPELHKNDYVDLLVQNMASEIEQTSVIAKKVRVLGVQTEKGKKSLLLNINQNQVQSVLFARGLHLQLQLLLYPAGVSS